MGDAAMVEQAITVLHDEVIPGIVAAQQRIALAETGQAAPDVLSDAHDLLTEAAASTHKLLSRMIRVRIVGMSEGTIDLTAVGLDDLRPADPSPDLRSG